MIPSPNSYPGDWLTLDRAAVETQMPLILLESAIEAGELAVRVACGARIVRRCEAQAWALLTKAKARECEGCNE